MGALQDKRNRSLDSVWASNKEIIAVLEAMMGVTIGTDSGPLFIQDAGEKQQYKAYIDKPTGRMYYCKQNTTSVLNDSNFMELSIRNVFDTFQSFLGKTPLVYEGIMNNTIDLNVLRRTGYWCYYVEATLPINLPSGAASRGVITIINASGHVSQHLKDSAGNEFTRYLQDSNISQWRKVNVS